MSDKPITITIKGKVGYEDEITVAQAAQIITFLNAAEGEGVSLGTELGSAEQSGLVSTGRCVARTLVGLTCRSTSCVDVA